MESLGIVDTFKKTLAEKQKLNMRDKKILRKEYLARYRFKTKTSVDIKHSLIIIAEKIINRQNGRNQLMKYVNDDLLVWEMERGLFEFSLVNVMINNFQDHFVENIYNDKLYDLCCNLDVTNKSVDNQTLLENVKNGIFNSYFIAFFQKEVLHPKRWNDQLQKQQTVHNVMSNLQFSDSYICKKCRERKFNVIQLQLRGSDEKTSNVITCMNCSFTFIT